MKLWYTFFVELCSTVKKDELIKCLGKWRILEKIIFHEANLTQKDKCCIFSLICDSYPQSSDLSLQRRVPSETKGV